MNNNINFYNLYNINITNNNKFIKDNIENTIINFNKVKEIYNNLSKIDEKYYKYLLLAYFIITNTKRPNIFKNNTFILANNTYNILKNKFILWPKNNLIFVTYSLFSNILNKSK